MAGQKILVVDDEVELTDLLKDWLEAAGYEVIPAYDGSSGLRGFFQAQPDLVVLDITMPGLNGFDLCQRIREVSEIPVLVLSAKGMEEDKVRGLRIGADDYLVKPIGRQEFLARIEAALRRAQTAISGLNDVYTDGIVKIDFRKHEVLVCGQPLSLTPIEYRLLACFVQHPDQVMTQEQLWDRVWGWDYGSLDSVRWHVSGLRRKIQENAGDREVILTVRGVGYRYCRS